MANVTYTQCKLRRIKTEQTAWIPTEFAKIGKLLKIKGVNGWKVISTGGTKSEDYFKRFGRDHVNQRKASDI